MGKKLFWSHNHLVKQIQNISFSTALVRVRVGIRVGVRVGMKANVRV